MVAARQSTTAEATGDVTATFSSAPLEGSLMVAVLMNRGDVGNDPTPSVPSGWTLGIVRNTIITNASFRRGFAVAWKVAGASEPSGHQFNYNAQNFNTTRVLAQEFTPGSGQTFEFLEPASNDNGATSNGQSLATGTTAAVAARDLLIVGCAGARVGGTTPRITGTSSWASVTLGDIVSTGDTGSNSRMCSMAWAEFLADAGGTKASTATMDPDPNENTGLSAGLLVFALDDAEPGDATGSASGTYGWTGEAAGLSAPPVESISDDFDRTNQSGWGTTAEGWSWLPQVGGNGYAIVDGRGVSATDTGDLGVIRAQQALNSNDMRATLVVEALSTDDAPEIGPTVRHSADGQNFYALSLWADFFTQGLAVGVSKRVDGTYRGVVDTVADNRNIIGGSLSFPATVDLDVWTEGGDTHVRAWLNGTMVLDLVDDEEWAIPSGTASGVQGYRSAESDTLPGDVTAVVSAFEAGPIPAAFDPVGLQAIVDGSDVQLSWSP